MLRRDIVSVALSPTPLKGERRECTPFEAHSLLSSLFLFHGRSSRLPGAVDGIYCLLWRVLLFNVALVELGIILLGVGFLLLVSLREVMGAVELCAGAHV